jgi:hypothetical protein
MEAIFCIASFAEEDGVCILLRFDQGTQEEIACPRFSINLPELLQHL